MAKTAIPFETRFPQILTDAANTDTAARVAEHMTELAARVGEEAFHYVCGAVFMLGRMGPITWGVRVAALRSLYDDQGLSAAEVEEGPVEL